MILLIFMFALVIFVLADTVASLFEPQQKTREYPANHPQRKGY